ncbi:hypothetical protein SLS62_003358 [Diatrype stigma]|uniref:HMG box domain-containing protein n=1 Tax=Diatrype stigma TaxID=117547 RepID=A0AAN9UST3_9PEZI
MNGSHHVPATQGGLMTSNGQNANVANATGQPVQNNTANAPILGNANNLASNRHRPRPRYNAWMAFRMAHEDLVKAEMPELTLSQRSKEIGRRWRALPSHEKAEWARRTTEAKRQFKIQYPDYKYTPRPSNTIPRRNGGKGGKNKKAAATPVPAAIPLPLPHISDEIIYDPIHQYGGFASQGEFM